MWLFLVSEGAPSSGRCGCAWAFMSKRAERAPAPPLPWAVAPLSRCVLAGWWLPGGSCVLLAGRCGLPYPFAPPWRLHIGKGAMHQH